MNHRNRERCLHYCSQINENYRRVEADPSITAGSKAIYRMALEASVMAAVNAFGWELYTTLQLCGLAVEEADAE